MTDTLEDLADKVDEAAKRITQPATFQMVRDACNEAGVHRARRAVDDALVGIATAQEAKRQADSDERDARKELDKALVAADWALVPPDVNDAGAKLLAADKAAWKKAEAAKEPAVIKAEAAVRAAEHITAEARDAVSLADKRFKACCADLDAAVAILNALREALPARKADR